MTANHDQDALWMARALELARRGTGLCSPNPMVGCVILDSQGQLAGEGWHEFDKLDHAEVMALKAAGDRARGGTAYVTREPCNHTGRTGPCSQALIAAGIARVVAATGDPNPLVSGAGFATLRRAGVTVEVGLCQPQARAINEAFAAWIRHRRPFVEMKVAMTLDGRIAPPPGVHHKREPFWITSEASRAAVQPLRWQADAVLTGVDTVIADDPQLTDRSAFPRRRKLLRVILDSELRIPLDSKIITQAQGDVLIYTVSDNITRRRDLEERGIRVEVLPDEAGKVPLSKMLASLGEKGILRLLTETGSRLNTAFLNANLVDRIRIFWSPQLLGSDAVPAVRTLPTPIRLDRAELERYGNDFCVGALLLDPWPPEPTNSNG
jgi:diaminohydroxyphosphoribosylaminopyrimidine deaminase/5-amino-6-(5-phosphoribosylamino)uracil reductase